MKNNRLAVLQERILYSGLFEENPGQGQKSIIKFSGFIIFLTGEIANVLVNGHIIEKFDVKLVRPMIDAKRLEMERLSKREIEKLAAEFFGEEW